MARRKFLSSEEVQHLYSDIYDAIASAQADAKTQGGNIIILLADDHDNLNSSFVEIMIYDICSRLGIQHLGLEVDKKTMYQVAVADKILAGVEKLPPFSRELRFSRIEDRLLKGDTDHERVTTFVQMAMPCIFHLHADAVDPSYTSRNKAADALHEPNRRQQIIRAEEILGDKEVDRSMGHAILKLGTLYSNVCCLGAQHIPRIHAALRVAGQKVLVINCRAGDKSLDEKMRHLMDRLHIHSSIMDEAVERAHTLQQYFTPAVPYYPQLSPGDALRKVLAASTQHQLEIGEIGMEEAQRRLLAIKKAQAAAGKKIQRG